MALPQISRKNIYALCVVVSIVLIFIYAFSKTNYIWTSETTQYFIFNAFWAVVVIFVDKFFHEKLQTEHDDLKTKIDKIKGKLVTEDETIRVDCIRLILNGRDEEISAEKAKASVEAQIGRTDPVRVNTPINLNYQE